MAPKAKDESQARITPDQYPAVLAAKANEERLRAELEKCVVALPVDNTEANAKLLLAGRAPVDNTEAVERTARVNERRRKELDLALRLAEIAHLEAWRLAEEDYVRKMLPEYSERVLKLAQAIDVVLEAAREEYAFHQRFDSFREAAKRVHVRRCSVNVLDLRAVDKKAPSELLAFARDAAEVNMLPGEWVKRWGG